MWKCPIPAPSTHCRRVGQVSIQQVLSPLFHIGTGRLALPYTFVLNSLLCARRPPLPLFYLLIGTGSMAMSIVLYPLMQNEKSSSLSYNRK